MTEDDLRTAINTYNHTLEQARADRDAAITRAAAEGMRQVDIVRITGYSRETIRRILRQQ